MFEFGGTTEKFHKVLEEGTLRQKEEVIDIVIGTVRKTIGDLKDVIELGAEEANYTRELSQHQREKHDDVSEAKKVESELKSKIQAAKKAKQNAVNVRNEARALLRKVDGLRSELQGIL